MGPGGFLETQFRDKYSCKWSEIPIFYEHIKQNLCARLYKRGIIMMSWCYPYLTVVGKELWRLVGEVILGFARSGNN